MAVLSTKTELEKEIEELIRARDEMTEDGMLVCRRCKETYPAIVRARICYCDWND